MQGACWTAGLVVAILFVSNECLALSMIPQLQWRSSLSIRHKFKVYKDSSNMPHFRSPRAYVPRTNALLAKSLDLDDNLFDSGDANPIDAVQSLDQLVPRKSVMALARQTSNTKGMLQVLWHTSCYFLFVIAAVNGYAANIKSLAMAGTLGMAFVASFFFMALHETVHRSAFRSRTLNNIVMHIAGFLCLRPAVHYFFYHWAHHKYTGNAALDSEMQPSALDMDVNTLSGYLLYLSGLPFWFDAIWTTLRHAAGVCPESYLTSKSGATPVSNKGWISQQASLSKAAKQVVHEARLYLLGYLSLTALAVYSPVSWARLLWRYWILPSILGQPMLRFYLLAEHRGCRTTPAVLENTRTMRTNWFYRRMAWQMPFHREHHAWPYIPFHQLSNAHTLLTEAAKRQQQMLPNGEENMTSCSSDVVHVPYPPGEQGYIAFNLQLVRQLLFRAK